VDINSKAAASSRKCDAVNQLERRKKVHRMELQCNPQVPMVGAGHGPQLEVGVGISLAHVQRRYRSCETCEEARVGELKMQRMRCDQSLGESYVESQRAVSLQA
jgi:hypothetical protein